MKIDAFSNTPRLNEDERPQLSVITINLNNRDGLESTIKSVINQTFGNFEYIVIDGGSTDGSVDVIKKYENRISFWISEKDNGIYHAMNKGINKATGNYCLFINSGDTLFSKTTIEDVFVKRRTEDILYGNLIFDYLNGNQHLRKMPRSLNLKHMMRDTLWHPVSFIKRDLFDEIGLYNENFKIASDYDFFLKAVIVKKVSMFYFNQTIAMYRFDGISSLPANSHMLGIERRQIQKQYFTEQEIELALKVSYFEKATNKLKVLFK